MRFSIGLFVALLCLGAHTSGLAQQIDEATPVVDFEVVQPELTQTLAREPAPDAGEELVMSLTGWDEQFELVLADNPRLLEQLPENRRNAISARGDLFLSGRVNGIPGSWVRMNRIGGRFSGAFYDGKELYLVDSAAGFSMPAGRSVDPNATVLLRYSDLELEGLFDHGGLPSGRSFNPKVDYRAFINDLRNSVRTEGLTLLSMPVTIVADTQFENALGANAESTVIGRINFVDGIFSNQLGVGILLWAFEQLNDNGTLQSTDPDTLLGTEFRDFMISGAGRNIPFRGLAHLFTGRNLDGSTVGYAYINTLCSRNYGYGINQNLSNNTTSGLVFAHELGHNYSANHVDEGIMQARIGGSQEFSAESVEVMSAALSRARCLVDGGLRIFEDNFE